MGHETPNYGIFIFLGFPQKFQTQIFCGVIQIVHMANHPVGWTPPNLWFKPWDGYVSTNRDLLCHQETNIDISLNLDAPPESLGRRDDQRLCWRSKKLKWTLTCMAMARYQWNAPKWIAQLFSTKKRPLVFCSSFESATARMVLRITHPIINPPATPAAQYFHWALNVGRAAAEVINLSDPCEMLWRCLDRWTPQHRGCDDYGATHVGVFCVGHLGYYGIPYYCWTALYSPWLHHCNQSALLLNSIVLCSWVVQSNIEWWTK